MFDPTYLFREDDPAVFIAVDDGLLDIRLVQDEAIEQKQEQVVEAAS